MSSRYEKMAENDNKNWSFFLHYPLFFPHTHETFCSIVLFLSQAESFGTQILDEDGLLELIGTKPGKKSKYEIAAEAEVSIEIIL